jgi:DNA-binding MarR family transcriptional regulator
MEPVEELRYLMLAVQREGNRTLTEALRPLDLTPSQAEVLRVLQEFQPLSLIALGDLLICETGSPSRLVNGMVEAGLIERVPSTTNRRMVILTLTEKGQKRAERVREVEQMMYRTIT